MSMPRKFWALEEVGEGALGMCAYLWSFVGPRKQQGGPHWVHHTHDEITDGFQNVTTRTITKHLMRLRPPPADVVAERRHLYGVRQLVLAGSINGVRGFWLYTPAGLEDEKQPRDRSVEEKVEQMRLSARGAEHRDRGTFIPRSPEIAVHTYRDLDEIAARTRRDHLTKGSGNENGHGTSVPAHPYEDELTIGADAEATTSPGDRPGSAAAPARDLPRSAARELLAELASPLASLGFQLPPLRGTLELLGALIAPNGADSSEQATLREHVRAHVLAFAQRCKVDPAQRRWLTGDMFSQEIRPPAKKSRWGAIVETVALSDGQQQLTRNAEQADAEARRIASERAKAQAEAEARIVPPEQINAVILAATAESNEPYAHVVRASNGRRAVDERNADEHRQLEARQARNRELGEFRRQIQQLSSDQLLALQRELAKLQAAAPDSATAEALHSRQTACRNRLADLADEAERGTMDYLPSRMENQ